MEASYPVWGSRLHGIFFEALVLEERFAFPIEPMSIADDGSHVKGRNGCSAILTESRSLKNATKFRFANGINVSLRRKLKS